MHVDLVHFVLGQVVLLARCAHIGLLEHVTLTIVVDECPLSDIELPLLKKQRLFDVFLNDELVRFQFSLLFFGVLGSVRPISAKAVRVDAVMVPQDTLEVIHRVENMDADPAIVASWF